MGWLLVGTAVGLIVAWVAEYLVDWRHRAGDRDLGSEAARAMQAALVRSQEELAGARAEAEALRAEIAMLRGALTAVTTPLDAPPT